MVDEAALEIVDKFCYLGNIISACGGAEESMIARISTGWKTFPYLRYLIPYLRSLYL